jgi:uncharacterized alpha-E superfamily protein
MINEMVNEMVNESWPLLSRVADSAYWLARYVERAENVARFIGVNLHLQLDLPLESETQWQSLIDASGDTVPFLHRYNFAGEANVIKFLAFDESNPNSIYSCLRAARENARSIRETISSEMWAQVNSMYLQIQLHRTGVEEEPLPEILHGIRMACHMFQGIADATMSHNEAWHFLHLGRMLERADKTSRVLDVKYFLLLPSTTVVGTPYDDLHWSALLKSVSAFETYRKRHGRISPRKIVDFLVMDREFPRAIRYCMHRADESLHCITGTPANSSVWSSEQSMRTLCHELDSTSVDHVLQTGLHRYLDGLQTRINSVDEALLNDFFAWRPVDQTISAGA